MGVTTWVELESGVKKYHRQRVNSASLDRLKEMLDEADLDLSKQTNEEDWLVTKIWHIRGLNQVTPSLTWFFYNKPTNKIHMYVGNDSYLREDKVYPLDESLQQEEGVQND